MHWGQHSAAPAGEAHGADGAGAAGGDTHDPECLVKIERGVQHIQATQLRAIRDALGVTYDALLEDSSAQKTAQ